jgi:hypothetical protein
MTMTHLTLAQQAALITLAVGENFPPYHLITLEPCGISEVSYPAWKGTVSGFNRDNCQTFTAKVEAYGNPPDYSIYVNVGSQGQSKYLSQDLLAPFQDGTSWVEALLIYRDLLSAESTFRQTFYKLRAAILRDSTPKIPWKTLAHLNLDDAIHACANQEKTNLSEAEKIVNNYLEPPKPPTHDELLKQYARYVESHANDGGLWTPFPFNQWAEQALASRDKV